MNKLQHHGTKGMKWGVRKKIDSAARSVAKKVGESATVQGVKRDLHWSRMSKNVHNMDDATLGKHAARAGLEKQMKRTVKAKGDYADKKAYKKRGMMTDEQISRAINRTNYKHLIRESGDNATKQQLDKGAEVLLKYGVQKYTGQ